MTRVKRPHLGNSHFWLVERSHSHKSGNSWQWDRWKAGLSSTTRVSTNQDESPRLSACRSMPTPYTSSGWSIVRLRLPFIDSRDILGYYRRIKDIIRCYGHISATSSPIFPTWIRKVPCPSVSQKVHESRYTGQKAKKKSQTSERSKEDLRIRTPPLCDGTWMSMTHFAMEKGWKWHEHTPLL